jgi:hypothetical protein
MRKILILVLPFILIGQNYVLKKDVISAGGRKMTSTNYILQGTVSQTAVGFVEDTDYKAVIGFWHPPEPFPPDAPYINPVVKSGTDVVLTWNAIDIDTLGNPEIVYYYIVYRSTSPSFIPGISDSVGSTASPDTTYTDVGALNASQSYYYLVKAVDIYRNKSDKSNMGYKFNKFVNENTSSSSRNWVSMPWHNPYSTASDITDDLSPAGTPLEKLTNLQDDQVYRSWIWDPDFLEWYGTNFVVDTGRAYEMVGVVDDTVIIVGSNNPNGRILLNENPSASSRNWVSIPYNANYSTVNDITDEFCPAGDPLEKLTNLQDDQVYRSWIWDPDFLEWYGTNFSIEAGRGYEFVAINDTFWNPTEYTNKLYGDVIASRNRKTTIEVYLGTDTKANHTPIWYYDECSPAASVPGMNTPVGHSNVEAYVPVSRMSKRTEEPTYRDVGISHVIRTHFSADEYTSVAFTAFRPNKPLDALTESVAGCGVARKDGKAALWFDVGNFMEPWKHGEEVILIVEAANEDGACYDVTKFVLDEGVDIQDLDEVVLVPIPKPVTKTMPTQDNWKAFANENVIGYSLYRDDERLNESIIAKESYASVKTASLKPVILGGYETVFSSDGVQGHSQIFSPISYACNVYPNPFRTMTGVSYALPRAVQVDINVYDITGRKVKTLVSGTMEPGCYTANWTGKDDKGRAAAAGVYFIRMDTGEFESQHKVVLVR